MMKRMLSVFGVLVLCMVAVAQNSTMDKTKSNVHVNGVVLDDKGVPAIGASIMVKGTANGTITDFDGNFSLDVTSEDILVFSYVGYKSQELKPSKDMKVTLLEDNQVLDDVVVIGYGTVRKSDLTGAVASIKTEELNQTSPTLEQALIGHTPGVEVKQTSGAPGANTTIHIRGVNSVNAGSEPLYVIDGYPSSKDAYINPTDVESIEVLKDAASAAIYGSRAAGGVILITTKRGEKDKMRINLDYQFSMQQLQKKVKMMNSEELRKLHQDGYNNNYFDYLRTSGYGTDQECWDASHPTITSVDQIDAINAERLTHDGVTSSMLICPGFFTEYDTDWQDEVFSNAPMHKVDFSVSGGKERGRYMFSVGYLNQDGIISPGNHQRLTARLNVDFDVTKRFSVGVNTNMYYVKERVVRTDGLAFNDGLVLNMLGMPTTYPAYNEDGTYACGWSHAYSGTYATFVGENPLALANERKEYKTKTRYSLNANAKYKILDGFDARINAGFQISDQIYNLYRPGSLSSEKYEQYDYANPAIVAKDNRDFNTDWLLEATLNYNKTIKGKHTISAVLGYSMQQKNYNNMDASSVAGAFTDDRIGTLAAAMATETDENGTQATTDLYSWSLMSVFGRAMYSYDNRYTVSLTMRGDGCSRFGKTNRWGYFPSVSAGWNITNESWAQDAQQYVTAKLRASWGMSGNNNVGNYYHIATVKQGTYVFGNEVVQTLYPRTADANLGWEKTSQLNIGMDMTFLSGRINLVANYYYSVTKDLLFESTTSALTGWTQMWTNLRDGRVYNQGGDLLVDAVLYQDRDWKWSFGFNVSLNRNKVDGLTEDILVAAQRSQITHITTNGQPIGSYYGMVHEGLITEADYALIKEDAKHQGEAGYVRQGPAVADYANVYIGDVKWKDVNGDGKITEDDREIIGNNFPKFNFGFNTSLSWKGLCLSATFDGNYGSEVINFSRYYLCNNEGGVNQMAASINRYGNVSEIDANTMYRANRNQKNLNSKFSDYYVEDASFLRMTNLMLGYTIPDNEAFKKAHIERLYFYFSVDNAFTITKYSGYNPDVDYNASATAPGIDFGTYPLSRAFSGGIKLTL